MKKTHLIPKLLASLALLGNLSSSQVTQAAHVNTQDMLWTLQNGHGVKSKKWKVNNWNDDQVTAKLTEWNDKVKGLIGNNWTDITWDKNKGKIDGDIINGAPAKGVIMPRDIPNPIGFDKNNYKQMASKLEGALLAESTDAVNKPINADASAAANKIIGELNSLASEIKNQQFKDIVEGGDVAPNVSPDYAVLSESGTALKLRDGELNVVTGSWSGKSPGPTASVTPAVLSSYNQATKGPDQFALPQWVDTGDDVLSFKPQTCQDFKIDEHEILPKGILVDTQGLLRASDGSYMAVAPFGDDERIVSNGSLQMKKVNEASEATKLGEKLLNLMAKTPAKKGGNDNGPKVIDSKVYELIRMRELNLKLNPNGEGALVLVDKYGQKKDWSGKDSSTDVVMPTADYVKLEPDPLDLYGPYLQSLIAKDDDSELLEILRKGTELPRSCFIRLKKISVKEGDKTETRYIVTNWSGDKWLGDPEVNPNDTLNWVSDEKSAKQFKENDNFPLLTNQQKIPKLTSALIKQLSKGGIWFNNVTASKYNKAIKIGGGVGLVTLLGGGGFLTYSLLSNSKQPATGTGGRNVQRVKQNQNQAKEKYTGKSW